jgi:uncharacterized protein YndB with AHSA1/START domain
LVWDFLISIIMFKREKTILINTSVDKVFSYVANISRHAEWAANSLEIRHTAGPESGEGATYESVIHNPAGIASSFKGQIRVLHEESPHRFVYETFDTTGQYRWSFLLSAEGNGCRLIHRMERISAPWMICLLQPVILWPLLGSRQVQAGLEHIQTNLES